MAKFKTDYKDEVVDKRTRQIIDAGTGAVIHNNVLVKNTYTPKQVGDKVGAAWFNDAGKVFNGLVDGSVTVKNALSLNGSRMSVSSIVIDPAGNDYIEAPLPSGLTYLAYASAINGNSVANNAFVVSRFLYEGKVRFLLNRAVSGKIQIDYVLIYH